MKRIVIVLLVAAAMAGCEAQRDEWQSATLSTSDYQAAFEASRAVLAEDYTIARSSFGERLIETQPLLIQKTGKDRATGAYLSSGAVQNYRRTVICRLERGESGILVHVTANLQREGTSQAEELITGIEGGDSRNAGREPRWQRLSPEQSTYWADIGRDREAEADILRRIQDRVSGIENEMSLPPAASGPPRGGAVRQAPEATSGDALRKEVGQQGG